MAQSHVAELSAHMPVAVQQPIYYKPGPCPREGRDTITISRLMLTTKGNKGAEALNAIKHSARHVTQSLYNDSWQLNAIWWDQACAGSSPDISKLQASIIEHMPPRSPIP